MTVGARFAGLGCVLAALLATLLVGCTEGSPDEPAVTASPRAEATTGAEDPEGPSPEPTRTTAPPGERRTPSPAGPPRVVATVARGLEVPWGVDFLPDGSALVTERDSARVLRVTEAGTGVVGRLAQAAPQGESGLLGVAVSPTYSRDRLVFFYLTTAEDNRIVRARFDGRRLAAVEPILTGIPNGFIHDGGRLEFGPDGLLYASTGEIGQAELAQDRSSLAGKILRITPDGEPAPGNPFGTPVWSWGHRNVQGLAFDDQGDLWASEFGYQTWDELNRIVAGRNYGWPRVEGTGGAPEYVDPQVVWRTSEASPSGLAYADGRLWLAALRGQRLWRVDVSSGRATRPADFFVGDYGRMRTVVVAPDGMLWVTTSNRDGRGDPAAADDRILLVDPGS